jgi:hypothetical protein
MKTYFRYLVLFILYLFSNSILAESLAQSATNRGINETCASYLGQIEEKYGLNGLNITFAHPENPSLFPSLHLSTQNYNNGASNFSATLSPNQENCYLSTVISTAINGQGCDEISLLKLKIEPELTSDSYSNDNFIILTPKDNSYQILLTSSGSSSCLMTETRMMWPGN